MNGSAEKWIQQELLTMDDHTLGRVFTIMRAHNSARKERDLGNPNAAPDHNGSKKPEREKPQHVADAAQETTEPDLTMAETILDTREPDPLYTRGISEPSR